MSDDHLAIEYDKIFEDDKLGIKSSVIDFAHLIEQNTYIAVSYTHLTLPTNSLV